MQNQNLKLIVLAALLHDIGKLFERGEIFKEARKDDTYPASCPKSKTGWWETHMHSAHTHAFVDWLESKFDCLRELDDKSWKHWCAGHHLEHSGGPEALVQISDRLSSAERDEGGYYRRDIHRKTRLEPVTERIFLGLNQSDGSTRHRFPLAPLRSQREGAFPKTAAELGIRETPGAEGRVNPEKWTHLVSETPLIDEYERLGQEFLDEIEELSFKRRNIDLDGLLTTLTTLLERYTSNTPSATNLRHPDISLFDHLRTTAAIAQALYLYMEADPESPAATMDDPKWLLVCGDFSGIQKFIYNLTNKGAAKGLRGRSFYVQFFCRIAGDYILRHLGLTRAALLYNSGGKFYMLIPAHLKTELYQVRTRLNRWLLDRFYGDVFFGLGTAKVTGDMFKLGNMHMAWKTAALDLEKDRLRKFKEQMSDAEFFDPQTNFNPAKSCEICGGRDPETDGRTCGSCGRLAEIGGWLKETAALLTLWDGPEGGRQPPDNVPDVDRSLDFPELGVKVCFVQAKNLSGLEKAFVRDGDCAFLNQWADKRLKDSSLPGCGVQFMYMGVWNKDRPGDFSYYAKNSEGVERLGILRMDVDNLGLAFIRGLRFPERSGGGGNSGKGWGEIVKTKDGETRRVPMASISRMATLSRRLNWFFSACVPAMLEKPDFDKCQTIYAGGDDLFIIGSWHQLPGLAKEIRNEFKAFCCMNPDFSISGGVSLIRDKYPLYKGAMLAGQAEKRAKRLRLEWGCEHADLNQKDAFCFLDTPVLWEDMGEAERIKNLLESELEQNKGFTAFLSRTAAANKSRVRELAAKHGKTDVEAWKAIEYASWRWRTAYGLKRRYGKKEQQDILDEWSQILFSGNGNNKRTGLPAYTWLEMPVRWTEYLNREKGGK